jgi:zinc protease
MGYLADALLRPDFPEEQVAIVRGQMLSALRQTRDSTRAEAERLMREAIFPLGHPMHGSSIGDEASLAAIDRAALTTYHDLAFRPEHGVVAVAGGVTHAGAVELVERHFGAWSGAPPAVEIVMPTAPAEEQRLTGGLAGKSQSDIVMGIPAIQRSHPDYYALSVANLILGRFGLMGRLGESVRERQGMAYYVYSSVEAGRSVGLWTVNAGVDPSNVERAIASTLEEVRGFQAGGPTEREFSDAVGSVTGSLPLSLETSGGIANVVSDIVYYGLGEDYLQRYRSIMRSLTPDDIVRAARTHIDPDRLTITVVGPA